MKPTLATMAILSMSASSFGCANQPTMTHDHQCGPQDRDWRLATISYADANALRKLAADLPPENIMYPVESWFESGQYVLLCSSNKELRKSELGHWWVFKKADQKWLVESSQCWGCINVVR